MQTKALIWTFVGAGVGVLIALGTSLVLTYGRCACSGWSLAAVWLGAFLSVLGFLVGGVLGVTAFSIWHWRRL
jgi:hypothetical protein